MTSLIDEFTSPPTLRLRSVNAADLDDGGFVVGFGKF
jgi:hypothetical protein